MQIIHSVKSLITINLALDMGTTATRIYMRGGRGVELNEPSCIAVSHRTGDLVCVGAEAFKLLGRCPPHVEVAYPMRQGVVNDFDLAELMLRQFMSGLFRTRALFGARIVMVVPSGATDVEIKAFEDLAIQAGAREIFLLEAPVAAALGLNLPLEKRRGAVSVCLGGGTTQAAVFAGGEIVATHCVRVGGQDLNESIASGVRKKYGVQVGHQTIEQIKTTLGNAFPVEKDEAREVYGKDVMDGLPKAVFVSNWEIREMLLSPIERIVSSVKAVLERIPPELSEDVKKYGITLSGGTAMLRGMNKLVENVTGVECTVPRRSALACLAGAEKVVGDLKRHRRFLCSRHGRSLT
jgi:rod shape-determining protein MreB